MPKKNCYEKVLSRLANLETRLSKAGKSAISSMTVSSPSSVNRSSRKKKRKSRSRESIGHQVYTQSGSDIVHTSVLKSGATVGTPIVQLSLSPRDMGGTRLAQVASLWNRWSPVSLSIEVSSNASSTTAGQITWGWAAEVKQLVPKGTNAVNFVAAMVPSRTFHVHEPAVSGIPCDTTAKWYLTETDDDELRCQGAMFAVVSGDLNSTSGDISLTFKLNWTVKFESPRLPSAGGSSGQTIHCQEGYENYFTDSSNDWQSGGYLTLKHKRGGWIVPFPGAVTGVVYKLEAGAKLNYYDSATTKKQCGYAARIWDWTSYPALAVFKDYETAKAYSVSGDVSKCLKYFAVGDFVVPDNPAWTTSESLYLEFPRPSLN